MFSQAQWRSLGLHAASAMGGGIAVLSFAASHSVDLYAIVNQLNVVVAEVSKLVALVVPVLSAGYGVYKATTRSKLIDIARDPEVKGVIVADQALATDVPSNKVQSSIASLPADAKR